MRPGKTIFGKIKETLITNRISKVIVFASSRAKIDHFQDSLEGKLDSDGNEQNSLHKVDVVKVTGLLTVEEKAHNLSTFMAPGSADYNPRILLATSGATNAGIDSNQIYAVFRLDMPSTRVDIVQERDRAGRFSNANPNNCFYDISFSMASFEYKLRQIWDRKEEIIDNTYREEMETELIETLKLLTISAKCITLELEQMLGNPAEVSTNETTDPCNYCSVCNKELIGKKFKIEELKKMLFGVFSASVEKGGIEGKKTPQAIAIAIRKREEECKKTVNIRRQLLGISIAHCLL